MQAEGTRKEIQVERWRQKPPNFDINVESYIMVDIIFHLSWFLFIFCLMLAGFFGIVRAATETWLGGVLTLVFFCIFLLYPLMMVLMDFRGIADRVPILIKKAQWIKEAASTKATIVDRSITVDHTESDEYGDHNIYAHELRLRYTPTHAITRSSELTIWARVDQRIYKKYERREVARIYYSRADPSIFFIKHE